MIATGGLVLILAGDIFISRNKGEIIPEKAKTGINKVIEFPSKEISLEIKYTNEEQEQIDYFNKRETLVENCYVMGRLSYVKYLVDEMIEKYSDSSSKTQKAVKGKLESGLYFLNGAYKIGDDFESFAPYQTKAKELGLDMNRIKNSRNK